MGSHSVTSTGEDTPTAVSSALAMAQERLLQLRLTLGVAEFSQGFALACGDHGRFHPPSPLQQPSLLEQVHSLPAHLGWESARVTAVLRQPSTQSSDTATRPTLGISRRGSETQREKPKERAPFIKVYPSVAQGILREGQAAAGRVWLLLRHLDENGRGWVTESEAQAQLMTKGSPTYLFGKRQWRNIVKKGIGIFWQRDNGRLWLNSVGKTAAALGVWQLNGRPVQLPISALTEKIGTVRAHLYATFHSSRTVAQAGDEPQAKPIARESLTAQFNISPHTQRSYERKARVRSHKNYAIGAKNASESAENTAWHHGTAAFPFTDYLGKHGRPGTSYLAWQLPNHYFGPHQQACRGQQKRINRELADLFMKGMTGNDNVPVEKISRRFCDNGRFAAKVYNRNQAEQDVYWHSPGKNIWHVLEAAPAKTQEFPTKKSATSA